MTYIKSHLETTKTLIFVNKKSPPNNLARGFFFVLIFFANNLQKSQK
jgi:hypothetical protein